MMNKYVLGRKSKMKGEKIEIRSKNRLEDYQIVVKLIWRIWLNLVYMMIYFHAITTKVYSNFKILHIVK